MNLLEVYTQVVAVKDALTAGHFIDAWEKTLPLQQFGIDAARTAGLKASAEDAEIKQKIAETLKECEALCTSGSLKAGATGAIGDGRILQLIIQLVTVILSLVL